MTWDSHDPEEHPSAEEWHCTGCGSEWMAPPDGSWLKPRRPECGTCGEYANDGPLPEDWEPDEEVSE